MAPPLLLILLVIAAGLVRQRQRIERRGFYRRVAFLVGALIAVGLLVGWASTAEPGAVRMLSLLVLPSALIVGGLAWERGSARRPDLRPTTAPYLPRLVTLVGVSGLLLGLIRLALNQ